MTSDSHATGHAPAWQYLIVLIATMALVACSSRVADVPPEPDTASAPAMADNLPPTARLALDSGNAAFRAHDYRSALRLYRAAARAAPKDGTPLYGIYMVGAKLRDTALADSAQSAMRRLATQARIPAQRVRDVPAALNAYVSSAHPSGQTR